jgi:hypothetical protein
MAEPLNALERTLWDAHFSSLKEVWGAGRGRRTAWFAADIRAFNACSRAHSRSKANAAAREPPHSFDASPLNQRQADEAYMTTKPTEMPAR